MGLYLRKSVRVGPFRFNLSKGGVGVSVGIKGLRVGAGPRGNYVHMGAGGIYYRATIPAGQPRTPRPSVEPGSFQPQVSPAIPASTHGPMVDIDSVDATQIVDSSSKALLDEMNAKQRRARLWPWIGGATAGLLLLALGNSWSPWLFWGIAVAGVAGTTAAYYRDLLQKSVVLMYELDPAMEQALQNLHTAAETLTHAGGAWHVGSRAHVHDSKYHAGAGSLISRKATRFDRAAPPFVNTNIQTVSVNVGSQALHFFPDRVLIYDKNGVGGVGYRQLQLEAGPTSFIEDETVPADATVIGHTWRYVNKKGGPDRRFKDNRQLPICRYDQIAVASPTGLNELLHVSKSGAGTAFAEAVRALARVMPVEK